MDTWEIVSQKIDALVARLGEQYRHDIESLAHVAWTEAQNSVLTGLLSTKDVATLLNISERRVRAIAQRRNARHGVGWKVPGTNTWLFRPEELDALRPGKPGRPQR